MNRDFFMGIVVGFLLALVFACGSHAQSITGGTITGVTISSCGPPNYLCSSQNQNAIVQNVSPTPNMGAATGAGTIVTPSDFNNPVVRCTDLNSGGGYAYSIVGVWTGSYTVTPTGGDYTSIWNSDSTFLILTFSGSGSFGVIGFNPATQQCATALVPGFNVTGPSLVWSRTNNKLLYHLVSGTGRIESYTFSDATHAPSGPTTVFDFKDCTGSGITASNVTWQGDMGISANDDAIGMSVSISGTQDTGVLALWYQLSSGKCQVYHTDTATITCAGAGCVSGPTSLSDTYHLHDTNYGEGGWMLIGASTGGLLSGGCKSLSNTNQNYFWHTGTTTVTCMDSSTNGTGHTVAGFNKEWNTDSFPTAYIRNFATPDTRAVWGGIVPSPCCSQVANAHQSWNNPGAADTAIIITSTASTGLGANPTFATPLVNEIYGQTQDGTNTWRRFFHCYQDDSNSNFFDAQCNSSGSQDGKWIAWTSDWLETLGSPTHRIDVFIGALR